MTVYIVITCCLRDVIGNPNIDIREWQYKTAITTLLSRLERDKHRHNIRVIIVENNGFRETFLDQLGPTLYTNNNKRQDNKGNKELADIHSCIEAFQMKDDDFLVKLTGRYVVHDKSPFFDELYSLRPTTSCIIRYGAYYLPAPDSPVDDCITGLIGMRVGHVRTVEFRKDVRSPIEWSWGAVARSLPQENVVALSFLGVSVAPGSGETVYQTV